MQTGQTRKTSLLAYLFYNKVFYLMMVPPLLYYVIFCYAPMFGIVIAFKQYTPRLGFGGSPWVGLKHFEILFTSNDFPMVMKNTVIISLLRLVWGFPMPVILSLLLNEVRNTKFKRVTQSISYMPHFLSWVIVGGLIRAMFSMDGPINSLFSLFGTEPVIFLQNSSSIRSVLVFTAIWKEVGWGTLLYLAAISAVDTDLYEAAVIDGAGRFMQMLHVTLPAIIPTMIILFILNTGSILNAGFEQIMMLQNPMTRLVTEIIDTYVYKMGILSGSYSLASAAGIFKSTVGMALVLFSNALARKFGDTSLL